MESQYGIPTASVQTYVFQGVVRAVAHAKGMPHQRHVYVPQPVMGKSDAELRAYIDGNDPVTGRPVMDEIIAALTRPLSAEEQQKTDFARSTPRLVDPATEEELQ
jgi:hypothetical protein